MKIAPFVWHSLGAVLIFFCAACGGNGTQGDTAESAAPEAESSEQADVSQDMIEQGEAIFTGQGICYTCHGQDATGTQLAPDLTDDEWVNIPEPVTREKIEVLVKSGVSDPVEHPAPMPPMGGAQLSEEEIQAVSAYVYQLSN